MKAKIVYSREIREGAQMVIDGWLDRELEYLEYCISIAEAYFLHERRNFGVKTRLPSFFTGAYQQTSAFRLSGPDRWSGYASDGCRARGLPIDEERDKTRDRLDILSPQKSKAAFDREKNMGGRRLKALNEYGQVKFRQERLYYIQGLITCGAFALYDRFGYNSEQCQEFAQGVSVTVQEFGDFDFGTWTDLISGRLRDLNVKMNGVFPAGEQGEAPEFTPKQKEYGDYTRGYLFSDEEIKDKTKWRQYVRLL